MIHVLQAPPFATVQDLGRVGWRHAAVPPSGAMDPVSLRTANAMIGNEPGAAAVEWGIGAGRLEFQRDMEVALAGASFAVTMVRSRAGAGGIGPPKVLERALSMHAGDVLAIQPVGRGAWLYLALAGGIDVPLVLGSRSTYLPGRFGGMDGRLIRTGDVLKAASLPACPPAGLPGRRADDPPAPPSDAPIRVAAGPDRALLSDEAWVRFIAAAWTVSHSVSRAGYRLEGPATRFAAPEALPSAPVCPGVVQLPPGGQPIVLMPDGPTVGGYPRIAVVCEDLGRLAQHRPGEKITFREVGLP
ncbi:MAG: biotin-dependent carboxyltransferase family protein [Gemmatimonadales bacterium]